MDGSGLGNTRRDVYPVEPLARTRGGIRTIGRGMAGRSEPLGQGRDLLLLWPRLCQAERAH